MAVTALAMNNIDSVLHFVCDDCDGGWHIPGAAWGGVAYFVFAVSVLAYFLMCWGNQHVDPSLLGIYTVIQPVATVMVASLVIALSNSPHWGLKGLKLADLGAIGVVSGLCIVVYDNMQTRHSKAEEALLQQNPNQSNEERVENPSCYVDHGLCSESPQQDDHVAKAFIDPSRNDLDTKV